MKKKLQQLLDQKTISLAEFSQEFTAEQRNQSEQVIRYYDVLVSLRQERKRLGLTQAEMAERAQLPRTTISKVESGKYNATVSTLMSMAAALDKTLQIRVI